MASLVACKLDNAFSLGVGGDNHRLKSAVDTPTCVLKRGDLCDRKSSRENEARFLHQNEGKICATEKQNGCHSRFVPHAFAQAAQRKHKIRLAVSHCRRR